MENIDSYFDDLKDKARTAQNKNALKFIAHKGSDAVKSVSLPYVNPSMKKKAIRLNKQLVKIIRKRAKHL